MNNFPIAYAMKRKAKKMASGGTVRSGDPEMNYADGGFVSEEKRSGYVDHAGDDKRPNSRAMSEDERSLGQHGAHEVGPEMGGEGFHDESYMGNPGNAWDNYQSTEHEEDMVGRVMAQREQSYSEGGKVANSDEIEAGFSPNEFDDLHLRDDLESSYTGANSGDELGNAREDKDREDIISRIMRSRALKNTRVG